ncbi:MAG TPA: ATP-binding protein [Patescibacteria group bacterium]|nr:ATP-binding protein [Patescibacteria group bacterium]
MPSKRFSKEDTGITSEPTKAELQLSVIEKALDLIAGRSSLDDVVGNVLENLASVLGYTFSAVLLFNKGGNLQVYKYHVTKLFQKLSKKALGLSLSNFVLVKSGRGFQKNFLLKSAIEGKIYKGPDLFSFAYPLLQSKAAATIIQKLSGLRYYYAIPLIVGGKPIGVLAVAQSAKDEKVIDDEELLKKFAQVISIAINDAQLLENIEKKYLELEELHRLQSLDAAKNEFIRVVSHQFRTPLTGLRLQAEYILEKHDLGDLKESETLDAMRAMYDRTLFLIRVLNDVFNTLDIEQGDMVLKKEKADFADIAKDVEVNVRSPFLNKKKILSVDVSRVRSPVMIDADKVRRILIILLTNALTFTREDGKASLEAHFEGKGKKRSLIFSIADNGIGIPKNEQKKIFEKFYRASNAVDMIPDGTGLGLHIVKHFVKLHGGEIAVKSAEGKGTAFTISLPVS